MRNALVVVGIGTLVLAGGWWYLATTNTETARMTTWQPPTSLPTDANKPKVPPPSATMNHGAGVGEENTVEFSCAGGRSMTAVFARDILGLTLSDGRQLTLREAASDSGVRYLNNTETVEFRGEGTNVSLLEEGETTYADCVAAQ